LQITLLFLNRLPEVEANDNRKTVRGWLQGEEQTFKPSNKETKVLNWQ